MTRDSKRAFDLFTLQFLCLRSFSTNRWNEGGNIYIRKERTTLELIEQIYMCNVFGKEMVIL